VEREYAASVFMSLLWGIAAVLHFAIGSLTCGPRPCVNDPTAEGSTIEEPFMVVGR
jgi:hypothetical protein